MLRRPGMCNRARSDGEPESLTEPFGAGWLTAEPMEIRFNPKGPYLDSRTDVVGEQGGRSGLDVMHWDVAARQ